MKKNKFLSCLLVILIFASMFATTGSAEAATSDDYSYYVNGDGTTCTITEYRGAGGDLTIPDLLDGYSVSSIGVWAFYNYSGLTEITIPDSVESIANEAFAYCSVTSVTIPDGVKSIGRSAFAGCRGLTDVTIPGSVESFGDGSFDGCDGLKSVTIKDGVESIGNHAFLGCISMSEITIPGSVKNIGRGAFAGCRGLTDVTIPFGVKRIGDSTFESCIGLTGIAIPFGVQSIGKWAFSDCSGLTGVTIPGNVESIGPAAFVGCSGLTDVMIPASVQSIGNEAFAFCSGLTGVTIPVNVTNIGDRTFYGCSKLSSVYFDGNKPIIGDDVFFDVSPLPACYYPIGKTGYDASFQEVTDLKTVAVPSSANGNITPSTAFGMPGETISLKITPDDGYKFKSGSLTYNDGSSDYSISSTGFTMPVAHITVSGEFQKITVPAVSVVPNGSMTKNRKPVWNWTDATGEGYYRYKWNDTANWTYTEQTNYTPANDLSDGAYTLYVQEMDSSGYWSNSGSATITVDNILPAASLNSPSGTGAAVTTSHIVLNFSENVTAAESKKVMISDGIKSYNYTIESGDAFITATGSVCSAAIPVSRFRNGTTQFSLGYGTTYTVAVEAGAYIDGAGNEIAASGSIGSFITAIKNTSSSNKTSSNTAAAAGNNSENATVTVTRTQLSDAISKAAEEEAGSNRYVFTIPTPIASISFDRKGLDTISKEASEDVKFSVSKVDQAVLSEEIKQIVGDRPVFDFSVTSGGKVISEFGGNVLVSMPYAPKPGEDTNAIVIYYINSDGKPETVTDCSYDPETGKIAFATNHFSTYAVGYHKVAFQDVASTAWYADAVSFVAAREITTGTGDGNYNPKAKLTRAQFLVMVMRTYGIPADTDSNSNFSDAGNAYYTGYLSAAKKLGITAGTGNNMYGPDKVITRQEMFTLLYNTQKQINGLPTASTGKMLTIYSDSNEIAEWARDAITLYVETGIISGSGSKLSPTGTATRAEMAQVLYNLIAK